MKYEACHILYMYTCVFVCMSGCFGRMFLSTAGEIRKTLQEISVELIHTDAIWSRGSSSHLTILFRC